MCHLFECVYQILFPKNTYTQPIEKYDPHDTLDWEMFWAIEEQDLERLILVCEKLKNSNKDIGMYFGMKSWKTIFSETEALKIRVYLCGLMDFSPVQHAHDIGWIEGMKTLFDFGVGCDAQGCGLDVVDKNLFFEYYDSRKGN